MLHLCRRSPQENPDRLFDEAEALRLKSEEPEEHPYKVIVYMYNYKYDVYYMYIYIYLCLYIYIYMYTYMYIRTPSSHSNNELSKICSKGCVAQHLFGIGKNKRTHYLRYECPRVGCNRTRILDSKLGIVDRT